MRGVSARPLYFPMENACFCGGEFAPAIFAADSKRSMPKPLGVLQTSARDFRQLLLCNLLRILTSSCVHCTCTEGRDPSVPGFPSRFSRPEGTLLALLDLRAPKNVSIAVVEPHGRAVLRPRGSASGEALAGKTTGHRSQHIDALPCAPGVSLLTEVSNMGLLLLIILIVLLLGGLPTWGYHTYGYGPSGLVGVLVIVLIVLLLTGRV